MKARRILTRFAAFQLAFLLAMGGRLLAIQPQDDEKNAVEQKPYTEAEIQEVLTRPLKLEDCIRISLSKNIDLQLVRQNLDMADAAVSGTYGQFLPVFSIEGTMERAEENRPVDVENPESLANLSFDKNSIIGKVQQQFISGGTFTFTGDLRRDVNSPDRFGAPPTHTENRGYSVEFRQPLLRNAWFSMSKSSINLAKHAKRMQENLFVDTQLRTIFAVKSAYYDVLMQKELIKVNLSAMQRDSTLIRLSESKLRANLATRRDVLSADIRLAEDRAAYIAAQTDYNRSLDVLKDVMGIPIAFPITLEEVELSYSTDPLDEEVLIRHALENNPLLKFAEESVKNADLKARVQKNKLLPQLDLTLLYNGQFDSDKDLNKEVRSNGFLALLSLSYPFLDRAAAASAEVAQISYAREQTNYNLRQRQLVLSIRDVVRNTYSGIEELAALKGTIQAAQEKVDFASMMFNLGRASNLDVTDAQERLLKAQIQYVRKLINYHLNLAFLETLIAKPIVF